MKSRFILLNLLIICAWLPASSACAQPDPHGGNVHPAGRPLRHANRPAPTNRRPNHAAHRNRHHPAHHNTAPLPTATPLGGGSERNILSSDRDGSYLEYLPRWISPVPILSACSRRMPMPLPPLVTGWPALLRGKASALHRFWPGAQFRGNYRNADGSGQTDLTQQPKSDEGFPAWSPDGKLIAFTSGGMATTKCTVMNADGTHPTRPDQCAGRRFCPGLVARRRENCLCLRPATAPPVFTDYIMNMDGSQVKRLTDGPSSDYTPAWSPDGKQIALPGHP